ncbi:hypothetical protein MBLNU459_g2482t2 [Dothideomycetes sp. NU459]
MRFSRVSVILTGLLFTGGAVADWYGGQYQCPPDVVALATGIHLNIVGQEGELNATETLQQIEAASPVNQTAFLIGKGELIADVLGGMKIREFNQAVAPANNAALPGLAKYAAAQSTELGLAESLTGVPSHDASILATLVSDIHAGIQLNYENLANVGSPLTSTEVTVKDGAKKSPGK